MNDKILLFIIKNIKEEKIDYYDKNFNKLENYNNSKEIIAIIIGKDKTKIIIGE